MKPFHKMKRKPPHGDDLAGELRKRVDSGRLTFTAAEVRRIADVIEKLSYRCAEAYQVAGSLAADAGCHEDRAVVKAMDLLFQPLRAGDILPFDTRKDRAKFAERQRLAKKQGTDKGATKAKAPAKVQSASKRGSKKAPI